MTFEWKCEPRAEALILRILDEGRKSNGAIGKLEEELREKCSTRLQDWIDTVSVRAGIEEELTASGFVGKNNVWHHPGAQLPRVVVGDEPGVAVVVDQISDYLMVRGLHRAIEGTPLSGFRKAAIEREKGVTLWVVERRATLTLEPTYEEASYPQRFLSGKEMWKTRSRASFEETMETADQLIDLLGQDLAAHVVIEAEREYWQSRNFAGQIQKSRQDRVGMGWANHDHHTFRSSRRNFRKLVHLFEKLGFYCRESFYPGPDAGWGAQVLENPRCRLVLFTDVDLLPHEHAIDFAHQPLPELDQLGTVGLWCELHGDSILQAGLHHVEAQFDFDLLREDLNKYHISFMDPFSNLHQLKQAFSKGEMWPVDPQILSRLVAEKKITQAQADKFKNEGALGSHLENLQRKEGFKGFNQKNITDIIKRTDPRISFT